MKHALVTGASGFLGSALVRRLVAEGWTVHAFVRQSSSCAHLADLGLVFELGDLRDGQTVDRAVAALCAADPSGVVVHSGAVISYRSRDSALQRAVNVDGTRHVLEACRRHKVRRLVHVSSVVAVGVGDGKELMDEDKAFNGSALRVDYIDTKRAAEELVLQRAQELDAVIVNPGAIFGPSPHPNTSRSLALLARGSIAATPPGTLGVVGLDDVVAGILHALELGRSARRYLLVESNWSYAELFARAAALLEVRPPGWRLPRNLCSLVAGAATVIDRLRPLELATPQALRLMSSSFACDARRARQELGWRPRPFDQVLAEAVTVLVPRAAGNASTRCDA